MVEIKNLEYVGFALVGLEVSSLKTNVLLPGVAEDWTIAFFVVTDPGPMIPVRVVNTSKA